MWEEPSSENLELILPPSIAHYSDFQGVWIKNNHLEPLGLKRDTLAIVAQDDDVERGDLVAVSDIRDGLVSCGFYELDFGVICVEGMNSEVQLFDKRDVRVLGKIIGVCKGNKDEEGKLIVEPIEF